MVLGEGWRFIFGSVWRSFNVDLRRGFFVACLLNATFFDEQAGLGV